MKRTKIICTIGPASESEACLKQLIAAGMNVARLNFSHGSHEEHLRKLKIVRSLDKKVAALLDTKGPEIRTEEFNGDVQLKKNSKIVIRNKTIVGDKDEFSVTHKTLHKDLKVGDRVLLDDGLIELKVQKIQNKDIFCKIMNSGVVTSRRGVNLPDSNISLPSLTSKDKEDILFGIKNNVDFIALSFVRSAEDVVEVRKMLKAHNAEHIELIAKIEHTLAVKHIEDIIDVSDGIMIARGDLAIEYEFEKVPLIQKKLLKLANNKGKFTIVATQMLESMIKNPRPTRAEVNDVASAILDRTDCVMLSGETAKGSYPVQAVKVMTKVIQEIERNMTTDLSFDVETDIYSETIAKASVFAVNDMKLKNIVVPTKSGFSARLISKHRPNAKIYALVRNETVLRKMAVCYGVEAYSVGSITKFSKLISKGLNLLLKDKKVKKDERILIAGSYHDDHTNTMTLNVVKDIL